MAWLVRALDRLEGDQGIRGDIHELTQTIARPFGGIFEPPDDNFHPKCPAVDSARLENQNSEVGSHSHNESGTGLREDIVEFTGTVTNGVARLSKLFSQLENNSSLVDPSDETKKVEIGVQSSREEQTQQQQNTEINVLAGARQDVRKLKDHLMRFASNLLALDEDENECGPTNSIELDEQIIHFITDMCSHPEIWLNFPTVSEDNEVDEFVPSEAQLTHCEVVLGACPVIGDLQDELCPHKMSVARFWKIYFVLLIGELNSKDAFFLSTEQVLLARKAFLEINRPHTSDKSESMVGSKGDMQYDGSKTTETSDVSDAEVPLGDPYYCKNASAEKIVVNKISAESADFKSQHPVNKHLDIPSQKLASQPVNSTTPDSEKSRQESVAMATIAHEVYIDTNLFDSVNQNASLTVECTVPGKAFPKKDSETASSRAAADTPEEPACRDSEDSSIKFLEPTSFVSRERVNELEEDDIDAWVEDADDASSVGDEEESGYVEIKSPNSRAGPSLNNCNGSAVSLHSSPSAEWVVLDDC